MTNKVKLQKGENPNHIILSYPFTDNAAKPLPFTMADYKDRSTYSGYDYSTGTYRLLGNEYIFRLFLKRYWYRNYGYINEAYALNINVLKRVIRAHYNSIGKDFKAVGVKD